MIRSESCDIIGMGMHPIFMKSNIETSSFASIASLAQTAPLASRPIEEAGAEKACFD